MKIGFCKLLMFSVVLSFTAAADSDESTLSLVFGSFQSPENANNWANRLSHLLNTEVKVFSLRNDQGVWYRVATGEVAESSLEAIQLRAENHNLSYWRLFSEEVETPTSRKPEIREAEIREAENREAENREAENREAEKKEPAEQSLRVIRNEPAPTARIATKNRPAILNPARYAAAGGAQVDLDLGVQTRTYRVDGFNGQSRFQPSLSAQLDYYRTWNDERHSLTFTPFARYDAEDSERTHFDVRELFWSQVGNDWDLHVGIKQVFWGVTEFHHLVDVLNQTDLVENIDTEDKLGQPMVHLSLVRDWGILDIFALPGFRERTFPGQDGRLRPAVLVDVDHPIYESGAENTRVDGAIRWSHNLGPFEFGLYHFSGTSREPQLVPWVFPSGEMVFRPRYPVIDQTGLEALALLGDWALKLEAITRSGYGPRYAAYNLGVEKTLVGILGTRTDLGLVAEYMLDDRDDEAFNTVFEHDLALGTRWSLNDVADTQALFGVIWDVQTEEYIFSMEASRRLGETWTLLLEGRVFGGAEEPDSQALLQSLFDVDNKTASLQRDDYIQLELTRYF